MLPLVAAAFGVINDIVFIAYDLWNLPGLRDSVWFGPYLAVKCLHVLACLATSLPAVIRPLSISSRRFPFNFAASLVALGTLHVEAGLLAAYDDGFASPNHLFRVVVYFLGICIVLELWVVNTIIAAAVAFIPLLAVPIALRFSSPSSWESRHADAFGAFEAEVWAIVALYVSLTLRRGWLASQSVTAERQTCLHLVAQAAKAQALLETAVPRSVARALIAGVPAAALTRSFPSASIAFIALTDFEERAVSLGPHELILWLDACYSVFDCLIDLYGEAINKIETVGNVYLVSAGLPLEDAEHHVALASFCADILDLCANINGVKVNVKIGLNCGPVTAGIIGETRRFYRVFGDTVNVASRMMSTGVLNRVHCTSAMADALLLIGEGAHGLRVSYRGKTLVKGKGEMDTYWVDRDDPPDGDAETLPMEPAIRTAESRARRVSLRSSAAQAAASIMSELDPRRGSSMLFSILRADAITPGGGVSATRDTASPNLHLSAGVAAPLVSGLPPPRRAAAAVLAGGDVSLFAASPRSRLVSRPFGPPDLSAAAWAGHPDVPWVPEDGVVPVAGSGRSLGGVSHTADPPVQGDGASVDGATSALAPWPTRSALTPRIASSRLPYVQPSQSSTADWAARLDASSWRPLGVSFTAAATAADSYLHRVIAADEHSPPDAFGTARRQRGGPLPTVHEAVFTDVAVSADDAAGLSQRSPRSVAQSQSSRTPPTAMPSPPVLKATARGTEAAIATPAPRPPALEQGETPTSQGAAEPSDLAEAAPAAADVPKPSSVVSPLPAKAGRSSSLRLPDLLRQYSDPDIALSATRVEESPRRSSFLAVGPHAGPTPKGEPAILPSSVGRRVTNSSAAAGLSMASVAEAATHSVPPALQAPPTIDISAAMRDETPPLDQSTKLSPSAVESSPTSPLAPSAAPRPRLSTAASKRALFQRQRRLSAANLLQSAGVSSPVCDSPARRQTFRFKDSSAAGSSSTPPISSEDGVVDGLDAFGGGGLVTSPMSKRNIFAVGSQRKLDLAGTAPAGTGLLVRRKSLLHFSMTPAPVLQMAASPVRPDEAVSSALSDATALPASAGGADSRDTASRVAQTSSAAARMEASRPVIPVTGAGNFAVPPPLLNADDRSKTLAAPSALQSPTILPRRFSLPTGSELIRRFQGSRVIETAAPVAPSTRSLEANATGGVVTLASVHSRVSLHEVVDTGATQLDALATRAEIILTSDDHRLELGAGDGSAVVAPLPHSLPSDPRAVASDKVVVAMSSGSPAPAVEASFTRERESICACVIATLAGTVPQFSDADLESEARLRLDKQSVDATRAAILAVGLLCLYSALTWLFSHTDVTASLGVGPTLVLFSAVSVVLAWRLRQSATGTTDSRPTWLISALSLMSVVVAVCVGIVGVLRPDWSVVIIRLAWSGRSTDLVFLQLPVIIALHLASFFALRYASAALVAGAALLAGLIFALVAGSSSGASDPALTGWLVFQLVLAATAIVGGAYITEFRQRLYVVSFAAAKKAEAEANSIVSNLLPAQVVKRIVAGDDVQSQVHSGIAILYADLVGFTKMSATLEPTNLMTSMNAIYSRFDKLVEAHPGLWKVETIGDAYIVVGGLFDNVDESDGAEDATGVHVAPSTPSDVGTANSSARVAAPAFQTRRTREHLESILGLAAALHTALRQCRQTLGLDVHMRIGVHCGDVVTGIIGSHRPRFSVLGLALMIAEQVESMAEADCTMCTTQAQAAYLASSFAFAAPVAHDEVESRRLDSLLLHDSRAHFRAWRPASRNTILSGRSAVTVSTGRSGASTERAPASSRGGGERATTRSGSLSSRTPPMAVTGGLVSTGRRGGAHQSPVMRVTRQSGLSPLGRGVVGAGQGVLVVRPQVPGDTDAASVFSSGEKARLARA